MSARSALIARATSRLSAALASNQLQRKCDLKPAPDLIEQHIADLKLAQNDLQKALDQIATLKAQLTNKPNPVILREAEKTLRSITEGVIGRAGPGVLSSVPKCAHRKDSPRV